MILLKNYQTKIKRKKIYKRLGVVTIYLIDQKNRKLSFQDKFWSFFGFKVHSELGKYICTFKLQAKDLKVFCWTFYDVFLRLPQFLLHPERVPVHIFDKFRPLFPQTMPKNHFHISHNIPGVHRHEFSNVPLNYKLTRTFSNKFCIEKVCRLWKICRKKKSNSENQLRVCKLIIWALK